MVGPRRSRQVRGSRKKPKPNQPQLDNPALSEFLKKMTDDGWVLAPKGKPGRKPKPEAEKAAQRTVSMTRELDRELEAERLRINEEHADRPDLQIKKHEHSKLIVRLLREFLKSRPH